VGEHFHMGDVAAQAGTHSNRFTGAVFPSHDRGVKSFQRDILLGV
jgi:hypothetical protein